MKSFNTTGKCIPSMHYIVDISRQVEAAAKLVREGSYFCINRGRQYGKTTTLSLLKKQLEQEGYAVFSLSFEGMSDRDFASLETILGHTIQLMRDCLYWNEVPSFSKDAKSLLKELEFDDEHPLSTTLFSKTISMMAKTDKIVLLIDEVDQASNYAEFIKFLGLLRDNYLKRDTRPTFQSVILAGVYDVKNLKLKIRPEEQQQYNSPWNIAVPFDADMSLTSDGIAGMLNDYKSEHNIDFDEVFIGQMIYDYTSGYPFLVSRICQIIDDKKYGWDKEGVLKATHDLTFERNTLFDDMVKKLDEFPQLKDLLKALLFEGKKRTLYADEKYIQIGLMFNFLKNDEGYAAIGCRLMETRLYNMFIGEEETSKCYHH